MFSPLWDGREVLKGPLLYSWLRNQQLRLTPVHLAQLERIRFDRRPFDLIPSELHDGPRPITIFHGLQRGNRVSRDAVFFLTQSLLTSK